MNSLSKLRLFLCVIWLLSILYGEMIAFWVPLWSCTWPHSNLPVPTKDHVSHSGKWMKVAIIADPQLMDKTSHGLAPNSAALETLQFYTDLFMRRSFRASILPFDPDFIIFLGDHFDGAPFLSDEEWKNSVNRFKHIFNLKHQRGSSDIPVHYLSGNHDIGYAGLHPIYADVIRRYENEFGARNYRLTIGNVEFVAVDAQTLDGDQNGNLTSSSWNFIKNVSTDVNPLPRVLLSHIPLYRTDGTYCGQYRASPIINQRISYGGSNHGIRYQNYLSEETTNRLLNLVKPILILSGHDHDQCTVAHLTSDGSKLEHTVGTFSWQQGNLYPSFMLLSVSNWSTSITPDSLVLTHLCFLPMQTHIYIWYLILFVVTNLLLLFWPMNFLNHWNPFKHIIEFMEKMRRNFSTSFTKEKDEDENCEYEMIWDAEGSMHLVKKVPPKVLSKGSRDSGLLGRGNAIIRSAARKHATENSSLSVDMRASGMEIEDTGKVSVFTKPKSRIIQKMIRIFGSLAIIATVNFPLYIFLLFKDWIQ